MRSPEQIFYWHMIKGGTEAQQETHAFPEYDHHDKADRREKILCSKGKVAPHLADQNGRVLEKITERDDYDRTKDAISDRNERENDNNPS